MRGLLLGLMLGTAVALGFAVVLSLLLRIPAGDRSLPEPRVEARTEAVPVETPVETPVEMPAKTPVAESDTASAPEADAEQGGEQNSETARDTAPEAEAVEVPPGSEFNQSRDDTTARLPAPEAQPGAADPAQMAAPAPDQPALLDPEVTQSASAPETGAPEVSLAAPAPETGGAPVVPGQGAAPQVSAGGTVGAPLPPETESTLEVATAPAAPPPAPETAGTETAGPETAATQTAETVDTAEPVAEASGFPARDLAALSDSAQAEPGADATGETGAGPVSESAAAPESAIAEAPAQPAAPEAPDAGESSGVIAQAGTGTRDNGTVRPSGPATPKPSDAAPVAETEVPPPPAPEPEEPSPVIAVNRLPTIGGGTGGTPAPVPDAAAPATEAGLPQANAETQGAAPADLPPLLRNAAEFENPEGKPLMAIVLIDDGSDAIGVEALADVPYPVSIALDPQAPDAGDLARRYRAAGHEVLALVDLPQGATARDVEVSLGALLGMAPEAVAVVEGPGGGFQGARAIGDQVNAVLHDSGHGLLLFPRGLNTAERLARKSGVPALTVFRDFDAQGQSASVIRRFLDQAAFKAGQEEEGIVMLGRLRAETISALILWGLQDRASRVALAPVSALLQRVAD